MRKVTTVRNVRTEVSIAGSRFLPESGLRRPAPILTMVCWRSRCRCQNAPPRSVANCKLAVKKQKQRVRVKDSPAHDHEVIGSHEDFKIKERHSTGGCFDRGHSRSDWIRSRPAVGR